MYTSFCEKSFVPLLGNIDANNICLNKLRKDVMNVQENVWSISQKVYKMGQTVSSFEKSLNSMNSKELTQLKRDFISLKSRVLDFIDLCQQVGCFESPRCWTADEIQEGMSGNSYDNIVSKLDRLEISICNLEAHMDSIEIQCRQFAAQTGKMDNDMCCDACTRVADSLTMNTKNINTLYTALVSEGFLTEKLGENLITNFQDGWQVVGPLFSTPASGNKGKNGVILFVSTMGTHSHSALMNPMKNIGDLKVNKTLNETNDMGVNRKVYKEQLKLIPVFNGEDTSKFRHWIKSIEKSVNSGFYNPHRICHMKAEGAVESFISKHLHEDWDSLKTKLRAHFSDLHTTQDCVKAVCGCKQGTHPMTSYIDEFEELIAGMDGSQTYIQCFVDGLRDFRIKILYWFSGMKVLLEPYLKHLTLQWKRKLLTLIPQGLVMNSYLWLPQAYRKILSRESLVQSVKV